MGRREPLAIDIRALERALRRSVAGTVGFDAGSRALYATDASNYRQVPIGVVVPRSIDDVVATVAACRRFGAPVLPRGAATSLCGQCCNAAVVIDMTRHLDRIVEVDPGRKLARVQPGVVLDDLRARAERHRLTFAPDPSTHSHNTLGGMLGNNSCGVHSLMGGRTSDNVVELDVLAYDGTRLRVSTLDRLTAASGRGGEIGSRLTALRDRYAPLIRERFPDIARKVSGYALDELLPENGENVARSLVGSEGTCAIVLEALVRLVDSPPGRALVVLGYADVFHAADHVPDILAHQPIGLEGIDDRLIDDMKAVDLHEEDLGLLPDGRGFLIAEFGGADRDAARDKAERAMQALGKVQNAPSMKLYDDPKQERRIWQVREAGLGATAHVPNKAITWEGWEDAAVAPDKLGGYLREFRQLLDTYGYDGDLYGHFGQGCVHTRIDFDLQSRPGIEKFRAFLDDAADLVVRHGGSISGEHGDGQSKAALLGRMYGSELLDAFREFKSIWDPDWKMNPGKVVDAYAPDENLRLGARHVAPKPITFFKYPDDDGSFARANLRCVGVGACRSQRGGTMCPSFRATRDEKHSTRGRARLLFEMLEGDVLEDGWRDDAVKDALDLCLACKGCKGDCPVKVDMATWKAEFLAHYYAGRLRPPRAYAFGLIDVWARLAARAPALVNLLAGAPLTSDFAKALTGMPRERAIPRFAPRTFRDGFAPRAGDARPHALLWTDTFNNHFHPETLHAAAGVLDAAGFAVRLPPRALCCGRPLYDFGMLERARRYLRATLDALDGEIARGTPLVVLEPSCAAVFRDELRNLFPDDARAARLAAQTFSLAQFLLGKAPGFEPPRLAARALVHGHCHQKALVGMDADTRLLEALGVEVEAPDSGCCGMAGSFGFEREKLAVSMAVGERVLLPAVRAAPVETLIVADGFSCREQIAQSTERRALHLAQVVQLALAGKPLAVPAEAPLERERKRSQRRATARLAGWSALALGAVVAWRALRAGTPSAPPRIRS